MLFSTLVLTSDEDVLVLVLPVNLNRGTHTHTHRCTTRYALVRVGTLLAVEAVLDGVEAVGGGASAGAHWYVPW